MINKEMMRIINSDPEMMAVVNSYMENDMRKLKKICYKVWYGKFDRSDYDELYDVAVDCLIETLITYNNEKARLETFLVGNIMRKTSTWMRDNKYRLKRQNLLKDENGKLILDEKGNPQIVMNVSLDMNTDEVINIKDNLPSRENVEKEIFSEEYTDKVELYLQQLPRKQERVARLLSQQYTKDEILEILHITASEYNDCLVGLRKYEYISILF
jgi:DNA-directed RNA polymerase specialized sigma24 family protein